MKYSKFFIVSTSLVLLNGCLDEDNDSKYVAQAINPQTAIISEQQASESSVTFYGVVVDIINAEPVTSALITVKLGANPLLKG